MRFGPVRFRLPLFVLVLVLLIAAPVIANGDAQAPTPETDAAMSEAALGNALRLEQERIEGLDQAREGEQAEEARAESQDAYGQLDDATAVEVARDAFPEVIEAALWQPIQPPAGTKIDRAMGDYAAHIAGPAGQSGLMESTIPLFARDDSGRRRLLDPDLEDEGTTVEPENGIVDTSIPDTLDEPVTVDDGLTVTPADAPAVDAAIVEDKAIYPNVAQDTDFIAAPLPTGLHAFYQLRSAESPESLPLEVEVPAGAELRLSESGAVDVVSTDGEELLGQIQPPAAVDSTGLSVPAHYSLDEQTGVLSIEVPHRQQEVTYPLLVDPIIDTFTWIGTGSGDVLGWNWASSTPRFSPTFNSGLVIAGLPGVSISAGAYGQYYFQAPGQSWIEQATFSRASFAPNYTGQYSVKGIFSPTNNAYQSGRWNDVAAPTTFFAPPELRGTLFSNSTTYHTVGNNGTPDGVGTGDAEGTPGNRVIFSSYQPTTTTPAYTSSNYLGGMTAVIYDNDNPSITSTPPTNGAEWVDDTEDGQPADHEYSPDVADPGVGVYFAQIQGPGVNPGNPDPNLKSAVSGCLGTHLLRCPQATRIDLPYKLNEGRSTLTATGVDALYKSSAPQTWTERVDRSAPNVTLSGTLVAVGNQVLSAPTYSLTVAATDGIAGSDASQERSGVKSIEILVDGTRAFYEEQPCAATTSSCAMSRTWTYTADDFSPGDHEVAVVVEDQLGHKTTKGAHGGANAEGLDLAVTAEGDMGQAAETDLADPTVPVTEERYDLTADVAAEVAQGEEVPVSVSVAIDGLTVSAETSGVDCSGEVCELTDTTEIDTVGLEAGEHTVSVVAESGGTETVPATGAGSQRPLVSTIDGGVPSGHSSALGTDGAAETQFASGSPPKRSVKNFRFVIPTDERAGSKPGWVLESRSLTDRSSIAVNVAFGNLMFTANDVSIPGAGMGLEVSRSWNSFTEPKMETAFGHGWSMGTGPDVRLKDASNQRAKFIGPSGYWARFSDGNQAPDGTVLYEDDKSGINARLIRKPNGEYSLLMVDSHVEYVFNASGRLDKQVAPDGHHTLKFNYATSSRRLQTITDTRGKELKFTYQNGNVTRIEDAIGRIWNYRYNSKGELDLYTDPEGKLTYYNYDSSPKNAHRLVGTTDANGIGRTTFAYGGNGIKVRDVVIGASNTAPADPGSYLTHYDYVVKGCEGDRAISKSTDPKGNVTQYCFDEKGRVDRTTDAEGNTSTKNYNGLGNVVTSNDSEGEGSTDYTMANDGHSVEKVVESGGTTAEFRYENSGMNNKFLPTKMKDAQGNDFKLDYSGEKLQKVSVEVGSSNGKEGLMTYTHEGGDDRKTGLLSKVEDGEGHSTKYTHDSDGDLVKIEAPDGSSGDLQADVTMDHDAVGRTTLVQDGAGNHYMGYDKLDRTLRNETSTGRKMTATFDGNGNTTAKADMNGSTFVRGEVLSYNERNLLKATRRFTTVDEELFAYTHDSNGNMESLSDGSGTTYYAYNKVNLPSAIGEPGGGNATHLFYQRDYQMKEMVFPNNVRQVFDYKDDHLTSIEAWKMGNENDKYVNLKYEYDDVEGDSSGLQNLRTAMIDQRGGNNVRTDYRYDHLNRLKSGDTSDAAAPDMKYAYDWASNLTKIERGSQTTNLNYNQANQLTSVGGQNYTHNASGSISHSPENDFAYNSRGQTDSIDPSGSQPAIPLSYFGSMSDRSIASGSGAATATMTSSVLGLNSEKTGSTTTFYTRMLPLAQGRPASDPYTSASYRGAPLGHRVGPGAQGQRYYYLLDAVGSVIAVTDPSGNVSRQYKYDPYGKQIGDPGTGLGTNLRFAGERREEHTGLYKIGTRYYDPGIGRWTQKDSVLQPFDTIDHNGYVYASADPVNLVDPSGRDVTFNGGGFFGPGVQFSIGWDDNGFPFHGSFALGGGLGFDSSITGEESPGGVGVGITADGCLIVTCSSAGVGFAGPFEPGTTRMGDYTDEGFSGLGFGGGVSFGVHF